MNYKEEKQFMHLSYGAKVLLLTLEEIYQLQFNNINKLKLNTKSKKTFGSLCSKDDFDSEKCRTQKSILGIVKK